MTILFNKPITISSDKITESKHEQLRPRRGPRRGPPHTNQQRRLLHSNRQKRTRHHPLFQKNSNTLQHTLLNRTHDSRRHSHMLPRPHPNHHRTKNLAGPSLLDERRPKSQYRKAESPTRNIKMPNRILNRRQRFPKTNEKILPHTS